MIAIDNPCTDPAWNLALEEYLLTRRHQDFFLVWRNRPSVIIGRSQNASAQINHPFLRDNRISVFRRISGGGAVYHDLGNVNFSFICKCEQKKTRDYRFFLSAVIGFLNGLGGAVRFSGKSDLALGSGKISGNAQHYHKDRVLHHGTILFDANLENLRSALAAGKKRYRDNAVDSIRTAVTNLRPALEKDLAVNSFMQQFSSFFRMPDSQSLQMRLSLEEQARVTYLAESKYSSWDWNFGRSPDYRFDNRLSMPIGGRAELIIRRGVIREACFRGTQIGVSKTRELSRAMIGSRHTYTDLTAVLKRVLPDSASSQGTYRQLAAELL